MFCNSCFFHILRGKENKTDHSERSSAILTHRYFAAEALSSSILCKMYFVLKGIKGKRLGGEMTREGNVFGARPPGNIYSIKIKFGFSINLKCMNS